MSRAVTAPTDLNDRTEVGPHVLQARVGVFGEQIVWECEDCLERRTKAIYYKGVSCDGDE